MRKQRWCRVCIATIWVSMLASACRKQEPVSSTAIHIEDDFRRNVLLDKPAKRIASLSPSNTEILFAIGCGAQIVLRDLSSNYPPSVKTLPQTNPLQLSIDHIAGFRPDLVVLSHANESNLHAFEQLKLPVVTFDPKTMPELFRNIEALGSACGRRDDAARLIETMQSHIATLQKTKIARRPRVYVELDASDPLKPWTVGPGSLIDHLVQLAGGDNVAQTLKKPYGQLNVEALVHTIPDVIVLPSSRHQPEASIAAFRERPLWREFWSLKKNNVPHVEVIEADWLVRPGPRVIDALESLRRIFAHAVNNAT